MRISMRRHFLPVVLFQPRLPSRLLENLMKLVVVVVSLSSSASGFFDIERYVKIESPADGHVNALSYFRRNDVQTSTFLGSISRVLLNITHTREIFRALYSRVFLVVGRRGVTLQLDVGGSRESRISSSSSGISRMEALAGACRPRARLNFFHSLTESQI